MKRKPIVVGSLVRFKKSFTADVWSAVNFVTDNVVEMDGTTHRLVKHEACYLIVAMLHGTSWHPDAKACLLFDPTDQQLRWAWMRFLIVV